MASLSPWMPPLWTQTCKRLQDSTQRTPATVHPRGMSRHAVRKSRKSPHEHLPMWWKPKLKSAPPHEIVYKVYQCNKIQYTSQVQKNHLTVQQKSSHEACELWCGFYKKDNFFWKGSHGLLRWSHSRLRLLKKVNQMIFLTIEGWQLDETRRRQILPKNKKLHPSEGGLWWWV